MGCTGSHRTAQIDAEGKLSTGTAAFLESSSPDDSVREQLSTIFETRDCAISLRMENIDVVLLGPCATRVAEASVKLNTTQRRPPSNSSTTEGITKEYYLSGMPQASPRYFKMRGASRGRGDEKQDENLQRSGSNHFCFSSSSDGSPSAKPFEQKSSEGSAASTKSPPKPAIGYAHKFKCCVHIEDMQVTARLWPVDGPGDAVPTFSAEKYGKLAYLGLVPIDADDLDYTWSLLSQRLDEIRYFAKVQGVSKVKLGCIPLLNNRTEESVALGAERLKNFAAQCASMGLFDLTNGGASIPLADTAYVFEVAVCMAAEWILDMS